MSDRSGAPDASQPGPDESMFAVADERVAAATGKGRAAWFAILDQAAAARMAHPEIARILTDGHGVSGWWAQSVTVDYERARGLRAKHEHADGFAVGRSRTFPVPVEAVYAAWIDEAVRGRWLDGDLAITSTQEERTVRGRWNNGPTRVAVYFTAKAEDKTQVQVQHEKLPDPEAAEEAKVRWGQRLDRLRSVLGEG